MGHYNAIKDNKSVVNKIALIIPHPSSSEFIENLGGIGNILSELKNKSEQKVQQGGNSLHAVEKLKKIFIKTLIVTVLGKMGAISLSTMLPFGQTQTGQPIESFNPNLPFFPLSWENSHMGQAPGIQGFNILNYFW